MWTFSASVVKKGQYFVCFCLNKSSDRCLNICVCLRISEAEKSINPCMKEYENYWFLSLKQEWFPTFTKNDNQPSINVTNCLFMPKTWLAGAYFHLIWSLLANRREMCIVFLCILNLGIFSHHMEKSLDQSLAYWMHDSQLKLVKKHKFSNRLWRLT